MKVFVYYNLHKKCWSIKALEGPNKGRVVAHAATVILNEVQFKVSEAGRQRVLREKKKNVHAGAVGVLECYDPQEAYFNTAISMPVTYNPYKYETFVNAISKQPILKARRLLMVAPANCGPSLLAA